MTVRSIVSASIFVALLTCPIASAAVTSSQTITIDSTWRAIGPVGDLTGQGINNVGLAWESSHGGWNSQFAFDDSNAAGWSDTIEVVHPTEPFVRYWVDGTDVVGSSPAYFRKIFNIPGIPLDGALDFGVDDDANIFVNGHLALTDADSLATSFTDHNIAPFLKSGSNLIAIKAQDQQGAQSIVGRIDVVYQIPEPTGLWLAISAIVSCSGVRARSITSKLVHLAHSGPDELGASIRF